MKIIVVAMLVALINIPASKAQVNKLTGVWFSLEYINALKKTRSPLKAEPLVENKMFSLYFAKTGKDTIELGYNDNFHEGFYNEEFAYSAVQEKHLLRNEENTWEFEIRGVQNDTLTLINKGREKRIEFLKLPEPSNKKNVAEEELVNSIILSGTYIDGKGNQYIFQNDGIAVWPKETFHYGVEKDFDYSLTDYFYFKDKADKNGGHPVLAYEWVGGKLYIFKTTDTEVDDMRMTTRKKKPLHILTKISE